MRGANGAGGSGCLTIHCGEWEQPSRELTLDVVASEMVSRGINGDEVKDYVDNKEEFEEHVMKVGLNFSLVVAGFASVRVVG